MFRALIDEVSIVGLVEEGFLDLDNWYGYADEVRRKISYTLRLEMIFGEPHPTEASVKWYDSAITFGYHPYFFTVAFNSAQPNLGIIIKFSAQAYSVYKERATSITGESVELNMILRSLSSIPGILFRCSRIDVALDYIDEGIDISAIYRSLSEGSTQVVYRNGKRNRSGLDGYVKGSECRSIYIGRTRQKNGRIILRIYDKKAEQLKNRNAPHRDTAQTCNDWTRFEVEFHEDYAHQLSDKIAQVGSNDLPAVLISAALDRYCFQETKTHEYLPITQIALDASPNSVFEFFPRSEKNTTLLDKFQYICKGSGFFTLIYMVQSIWGEEGVNKLLDCFSEELQNFQPPRSAERWVRNNYDDLVDKEPPFGEAKEKDSHPMSRKSASS